MISFKNDYSEGAHRNILEKIIETNLEQSVGYGEDKYTLEAKELIKKELSNKNADIHFISGGTQTNLLVISFLLRSHEAVISAKTGHINVHETGAIESTGHKVLYSETEDGKLTVENIKDILDFHTDEHMVKPKLVYISNATELGTIYTKKELKELSSFCKKHDLYLFSDGARLGSAITSKNGDISLKDMSKYTDVFYIGGTKNGALIGEAIVFNDKKLGIDFRFHIKQKGALLAKGKLLGVQFLELFKNNLFYDLATHANEMAEKLRVAINEEGFHCLAETSTNQIFPIFPDELIEKLNEKFEFYVWGKETADASSVRLVTSWATTEEMVEAFIKELNELA